MTFDQRDPMRILFQNVRGGKLRTCIFLVSHLIVCYVSEIENSQNGNLKEL